MGTVSEAGGDWVAGLSLPNVSCFVPSKEGLCLNPAGQVHSRGLGKLDHKVSSHGGAGRLHVWMMMYTRM